MLHGSVSTITTVMTASAAAATPTPISTSRSDSSPPRAASPNTTTDATMAPTKAAPVIGQVPAVGTSVRTRTAPRPAPLVTPRMPGSASGLRQPAWMIAPATASAAPAASAASTRGTRASNT